MSIKEPNHKEMNLDSLDALAAVTCMQRKEELTVEEVQSGGKKSNQVQLNLDDSNNATLIQIAQEKIPKKLDRMRWGLA